MAHAEGQQHPIKIYFVIWGLLFVLSVMSYMVDILHLEGMLRWSLISIFMMLKAALIVSVFMHVVWERMAIVAVILVPPGAILFLMALMALEGNHTFFNRTTFFAGG